MGPLEFVLIKLLVSGDGLQVGGQDQAIGLRLSRGDR